ncbi:MAG: hypothetical protein QMD44_01635 [Thermodesulfovibrionales bacterium]|jgi:hypothetical protein|nr:hypothetical protein [Thermodesulfovibrionales bacterium]
MIKAQAKAVFIILGIASAGVLMHIVDFFGHGIVQDSSERGKGEDRIIL